jgi:hypothetical protein
VKFNYLFIVLYFGVYLAIGRLENIYDIIISYSAMLVHLTFGSLLAFFFFVNSNKITTNLVVFKSGLVGILWLIYTLLLAYLLINGRNLMKMGLLGSLLGAGDYLELRIDRLGGIQGWFSFSLIIAYVAPPLASVVHGRKMLIVFALLSLLGGSRMVFFMLIFTLLTSLKLSRRNVILGIGFILIGLLIWAYTKDIGLVESLFSVLKRAIYLPAFIILMKLTLSLDCHYTNVGRELYSSVWGGVGNAPSFFPLEIISVSDSNIFLSVVLTCAFAFLIGYMPKLKSGINWRLYAIWLVFVSGGWWAFYKLIMLFISVLIAKVYENSLRR